MRWFRLIPLAICFAVAATAQTTRPPNFIIILADDLGYGDLGCFGSKTISTPCLDKMAAEGVRLTDFHVSASICSPSRASILTGRYAQRAGLPFVLFPTERKGLAPEEITIAELLKTRGYATACVGKWHLGFLPPFHPLNQGFDEFFGLPYSNDSAKQPANEPFQPVLAPNELPLIRGTNILEAPVRQETLSERYTDEAIRFIRKNRDRPFFLYLAHTFPHTPLHASQRFRGKSKGKLYGDTVECIDWSTGEILKALKNLDLDAKTLVCFTSDNGAPPGGQLKNVNGAGTNGPLRGVKFNSYEGGFRVPAIFRWPGKIRAGRTCNELAAAMDLFPTFAKLADANVPNDRVIDGKNIWPLLTDTHAKTPHDLFCYYLDNQLQAVRSGDWKLFLEQQQFPKLTTIMYTNRPQVMEKHFALRDRPALYNLRSDLGEKHDVAAQHPDVVKRLTDLAHAFDNSLKSNQRAEAVLPP